MNTDCSPCGTYITTEELINQTVICDGGSVSFQVIGMQEPQPPIGDSLKIIFDSKSNADLIVGNSASVSAWNTFFDLPTNGTPFDNISITGTAPCIIDLYGGANIVIKKGLFGDATTLTTNTSLLEIIDSTMVIEVEYTAFGDWDLGYGCYGLTNIHLPVCTTVHEYAFVDTVALQSVNLSSCTSLGETTGNDNVFKNNDGAPARNITLTIPHALEADGDVVYLKSIDTVTVVYSD